MRRLYGTNFSPFVRHCRIALEQAGLSYEFVQTGATDEANPSPTRKVPFFEEGDLRLSDSTSILAHLRKSQSQPFLDDVQAVERYCFVNTIADAAIQLFMVERLDGHGLSVSPYLERQRLRVESGLDLLEATELPRGEALGDPELRLVCFLEWGRFRGRFDLANRPNLAGFIELAHRDPVVFNTAPERY